MEELRQEWTYYWSGWRVSPLNTAFVTACAVLFVSGLGYIGWELVLALGAMLS